MNETPEYSETHPTARCPDCDSPLGWGKRQHREAWWCPKAYCPSFMRHFTPRLPQQDTPE